MLKRVIILLLLFFTLIYEILLLLQLENKLVFLCGFVISYSRWEKWTLATLMTRSAGEAAVENETRRSYTIEIVK